MEIIFTIIWVLISILLPLVILFILFFGYQRYKVRKKSDFFFNKKMSETIIKNKNKII